MNSITKNKNFKVDVAPDMSMYALLRNQSYQKSYALAEFIDNSIQAYLDKKANTSILKIDLNFYSSSDKNGSLRDSITIKDNAGGITRNRLKEAFKPANVQLAKKKQGLNEFGIGMKASAVWFTNSWTLTTVSNEDPSIKYTFEFDLNKLISQNQKEVEVRQDSLFDEFNSEYGTEITLLNLHEPIDINDFEQIRNDLTEFYQRYISGATPTVEICAYYDSIGGKLNFDNQVFKKYLVAPFYKESRKTLFFIGNPDKEWRINVNFKYLECHVTGFISILEKGSYSNPGIVMFRHNRVILGLTRAPILLTTPNKYARQRVYGELNVNEFEVSYTKDAFKLDLDKFRAYLKTINSDIELLLSQAENYRSNLTEKEKEEAVRLLNEDQIKEYFAYNKLESGSQTKTKKQKTDTEKPAPDQSEKKPSSPDVTQSEKKDKQANLDKKPCLIKKVLLRDEVALETTSYCNTLINQINRAYAFKKMYAELIVVVLRNILENQVDHCCNNLSFTNVTKFQDKLDIILDVIRNSDERDLTKITTYLTTNYTNTTFTSHQTLKNMFKASLNKEVIQNLISALHLTAHKGTNIISLGNFEANYATQYTILLEILGCISLYRNN